MNVEDLVHKLRADVAQLQQQHITAAGQQAAHTALLRAICIVGINEHPWLSRALGDALAQEAARIRAERGPAQEEQASAFDHAVLSLHEALQAAQPPG